MAREFDSFDNIGGPFLHCFDGIDEVFRNSLSPQCPEQKSTIHAVKSGLEIDEECIEFSLFFSQALLNASV